MRITNTIMQNNSLYNINQNKLKEDKLNTMISTGKKVVRPSDDPVTAIRALRLRSNVSDLEQFYDRNVKDARSWLEVTDSALSNASDILTDCISEITKAANKDLTLEDLDTIFTQIDVLKDEFYSIGDSDYAGRYIFTNYRTDTPLTFKENQIKDYTDIKELSNGKNINKTSHLIGLDKIESIDLDASDISAKDINTLRLTYDNLNYSEDSTKMPQILLKNTNSDGSITEVGVSIDKIIYSSKNTDEIYKEISNGDLDIVFDAVNGEILFSDKFLNENIVPQTQIEVLYDKNEWTDKDIIPEHLFECTLNKDDELINHNKNGVSKNISYDVGYSQNISINTCAKDVFDGNFAKDVKELKEILNTLKNLDEELKKENNNPQKEAFLNKAYDNLRNILQTKCENKITAFQNTYNKVNLAVTNNGTKQQRLNLIENRLQNQLSTFETLKSENEDIDIEEVITRLTTAQTVYNASIMAAGKMSQVSLLNYI